MADKKFPLEKILTISPESWMASNMVPPLFPDEYELVGVHVDVSTRLPNDDGSSLIDIFAREVPEDAIIVGSYIPSVSDHYHVASGTALVPKRK
jgi:hypothetical protein